MNIIKQNHVLPPITDIELATSEESSSSMAKQNKEAGSANEGEGLEQTYKSRKKLLVAFILVVFIGFVVADFLTNAYIGQAITNFLEWIEANPCLGFFVFMFVYFVATVLFIPGSVLTLGAGFVFANVFGLGAGVLLGALSVFFGASAGAIAAFLLGRYLLRDSVSGLTRKYAIFEALDAAFEEKGFRIMCLLRLSPIIPFNVINYIAGVTAISFWSYVWAMFAILPGTVLYVFLGASAGSLADSASSGSNMTVTLVVVIVGIIFGIIAVGVTSYYAKQELNKVVAKREAEQNDVIGDCTHGDDNESENENKKLARFLPTTYRSTLSDSSEIAP